MKRLIAFILFAASLASAQTTTFTANLKDLIGNVPTAYIELTLKNCAGTGTTPTIPHVNGVGAITFPVQIYPVAGVASGNPYDEANIVCGSASGVAYYHVAIYQGDSSRTLVKKLMFADDYDITGTTFNLNSATPRSGTVITPPNPAAVIVNPSGSQTVAQPGGTALIVNRLSATLVQTSNGTDMLAGNRFTDTSPTGNLLNFKNAAGTVGLWQVDVAGILQAGILPSARFQDGNSGTGAVAHVTSPAFVTPSLGAASATSISVSATEIVSGAFTSARPNKSCLVDGTVYTTIASALADTTNCVLP